MGSFRFDSFTIDVDAGELRRDERPIKLNPQPLQLLTLLVSRAGDVVTREDIQKELWPDDTVVDFDLGINSCVRQIRTALGDDADEARFVQTVPRRGYRFMAPVESARETPSGMLRKRWPYAAAAAVLSVAVMLHFAMSSSVSDEPVDGDPPSIAVLYFENASGDTELDWLRTGLPDMLVTDLSQSSDLEILSTQRLDQIVREIRRRGEHVDSLAVTQQLAREAGTRIAIVGSLMKAGDAIRIHIRVQEASTGRILNAANVEGAGESSLFEMVDELGHRIKTSLGVATAAEGGLDRPLTEVTTASAEAYRYWEEGRRLLRRDRRMESILLLEKALALDPGFASARLTLSSAYGNIGDAKNQRLHRQRAAEDAHRLPMRERYLIEGSNYALNEETYDRAFETLETLVDAYPKDTTGRNNLAFRYLIFERYGEAIEHYEAARRSGGGIQVYRGLAEAYSYVGRFDKGDDVLREYLARQPDDPLRHVLLADHFIRRGRLDRAARAQQQAEAPVPEPTLQRSQWRLAVLREDWDRTTAVGNAMLDIAEPVQTVYGSIALAIRDLYRGRSEEALSHIERAARIEGSRARNYAAEIHLARGEMARAVEQAEAGHRAGKGSRSEWPGLFYASLAEARRGDHGRAETLAESFRVRAASLPTERETRRYHHLRGELALARGDVEAAIDALEEAGSLLTPRGFTFIVDRPQHVPIWFSLGRAHYEDGNHAEAEVWFRRITDSTTEHIQWPIPYVRSFYFLGNIYERRGDAAKSLEHFRRFRDFWVDGDLDGDRVGEALQKIIALQ